VIPRHKGPGLNRRPQLPRIPSGDCSAAEPGALISIQETVERVNAEGKKDIISERVTEYRWGDKPPIPAGFFQLPDSENISAVLANPSGTLAKFNRMGYLAGFGDRDIRMVRRGYCYKGSLAPETSWPRFMHLITARPGARGWRFITILMR
jgi:hypothetical protein